jgi:diguanylate cyclase (GGDEF)-like protein
MRETLPPRREGTRAGIPSVEMGEGEPPGEVWSSQDADRRSGEEAGGCIWSGPPLSCLVIDFGSPTSGGGGPGEEGEDELRRDAASLLAHSVRSSDPVAWLEGGRFLVTAPGADARAVRTIGSRLLAKLRRHRFSAAGREPVALTVTIGTASSAGGPISDPAALVDRACEAVERGKLSGGNQVVSD